MKIIRIAIVALCLSVFAAESNAQDRTEAAFVKVCLASSNLSKNVCECSAKKAPLRGKAGLSQTRKAATFMARGPAQCARAQAPK